MYATTKYSTFVLFLEIAMFLFPQSSLNLKQKSDDVPRKAFMGVYLRNYCFSSCVRLQSHHLRSLSVLPARSDFSNNVTIFMLTYFYLNQRWISFTVRTYHKFHLVEQGSVCHRHRYQYRWHHILWKHVAHKVLSGCSLDPAVPPDNLRPRTAP